MPDVTAIVLCGGQGSRMGRVAKPLLLLDGKVLIQRVLERIRAQVDAVIISTNQEQDRYAGWSYPIVGDEEFAGRGPLAGFAAGLGAATTTDVLVVPGDAPMLPRDLRERLDDARRTHASEVAYAFDGEGPQPLCCLLPRRLHAHLQAYLAAGGDTPREWLLHHQPATADFSEVPRWAWSVNTPAEWSAASAALSLLSP